MWKISESTIHVQIGDIRSEWILLPLEDPDDRRRLLSSQLTGAWISEAIEIDTELVADIAGRCGRYPSAAMGGCTHAFIIMDTNMPEEGSAWHELMESPREDWKIFIQPGGLEPSAENLAYLLQTKETLTLSETHPQRIAQGRKYYERLARSHSEAYVTRYVHAKYGLDPSGRAVFGAVFKEKADQGYAWHVVDNLQPTFGSTLIIGQDFGRDPCAIICQLDPAGRLMVLEEIISRHMGLELHVTTRLRPVLMQQRYIGLPIAVIGDPAGVAKNNVFEITSFDFLRSAGFQAFPASTNDIDPRIRAIESWLLTARGTGPGMLIDRARCPMTIRALKMGYRYENVKSSNSSVQSETKPKPLKNEYSHVIDALQYACLAATGGAIGYINRKIFSNNRTGRPMPAVGGWT